MLWEETDIKNLRTLLAAETRKGKYVNAPQPKTGDDFSKLAWKSSVRNLLTVFSFRHLEPAILSTSHPFTPPGGCQCGMKVRPEITKPGPSAAEVGRSHLAETLKARFLAGINHRGPKKVTLRLCRFTPTEHLALSLWEEDIMCLTLHAFLNSCFEGLLQALHETVCPR